MENNLLSKDRLFNDINKKKLSIISKEKNIIDLTHIKTYTIDDSETLERDDAISIEIKNNYNLLWIHISNTAELIEIDSELEDYSLKRGSTIYGPKENSYMLPINIVKNSFSI